MKRNLEALTALLGIRRTGGIIFRCSSGTLTADELFFRASLLADKLPGASERVVVPSDDPIALLAGIAGCWLSNNTAVAWRKSAIEIDALSELTAATTFVRWDSQARNWHIRRVSATSSVELPGDLIILTSGSTGKPKGVALDLGRVAVNATLAGSKVGVSSASLWTVDADMSLISPLAHTFMAWSSQVPVQHLGGLDWAQRSELLADGRAGYGGAPLQIREMAQRLKGRGPQIIVSSGDFLPPALGAAIDERFPDAQFHKIYGLTEVSGRLCILPHSERQSNPAAAGFPMPGFEVFVDKANEADDSGEICVSGTTMMFGYWRTGGRFEPLGRSLFRTGDFGFVQTNGLVTVSGRLDDVFKVGAEKVDRHSIEQALGEQLAGHEFCVLPVIHPALGQTPVLFVASHDRRTLPSRLALIQAVRNRLPSRYTPSMILSAGAALPRLPNGKLNKQLLINDFSKFPDLYAEQGQGQVV
jgi:acyl-CoA synthetase (AMP-forming)/AMP-acid ligase II